MSCAPPTERPLRRLLAKRDLELDVVPEQLPATWGPLPACERWLHHPARPVGGPPLWTARDEPPPAAVAGRAPQDDRLLTRLKELAARHRCHGHHLRNTLLRRDGVRLNAKPAGRQWVLYGLKLSRRERAMRRRARHPVWAQCQNHEWADDLSGMTPNGTGGGRRS